MTTFAATFDRNSALAPFRDWQSEQATLDAQLSESLDALAAYQSQLDAWQLQLAAERDELRQAREQFERDRMAADKLQAQSSPESLAELNASRDKISALTTSLPAYTEELRTLDNRRAELVAELELARTRERELTTALEDLKRTAEQERVERNEELRHLREMLEQRVGVLDTNRHESTHSPQAPADRTPAVPNPPEPVKNNPVLGSIVEQFGKLRLQRATDRQTFRKTR